MANWNLDLVAERLREAVDTARRLPSVKVTGYFNVWPTLVREPWEAMGEPMPFRRPPPSPLAIERMQEVMRWMLWLDAEQRHLLWMRAKEYEWQDICRRLGCERTTAWRRWQRALEVIVSQLNQGVA